MTDLEQLQEDVRATAPQPRPEFAARLERNVEAGFKPVKPSRPPRRINLWTPSVALGCVALIAVVVALAGGGGSAFDDADSEEGGGSEATYSQGGDDEAESSGGGGGGEAALAPELRSGRPAIDDLQATAPQRTRGRDGNRVVVRNTTLELETPADEFTDVTDQILRVADDTGSIVQTSNVSEDDGRGYARYDLRVPASGLDETLAQLSRLARVTRRTASTQDITRAYVSATDRLDDARAERQSLLKALERADTELEAEALRRQIAIARGRIAVATRDVQALQRRADRAKVSVTVRSTGKRSEEGGTWTPGDAIGDAGRILEVAAGVVVVTAAALLPVALLALLFGLGARTVRRRRREAALGPAS